MGWDKATVNGAWSIGLLFTGLAAFPVGIFLDRLGGRIIMTGSTLLGVACLLLWSNTEHLSTLYVVCIGLGIAMSGSLYEAGFAVLTRRFPTTYTDQNQPTDLGRRTRSHYICSSRGLVSQLARMADNSPIACDYLARGMLPNSRIGPARAINDYGRTNGVAGRSFLDEHFSGGIFWNMIIRYSYLREQRSQKGFESVEMCMMDRYVLSGKRSVGTLLCR